MKSGINLAVSYCMQVDHGFAQPLAFLLGGLDKVPVLPVFIDGVATPLPVSSVPACWVKPLDVSPALSMNACCSWVRWAFPSAAGARTGESRCHMRDRLLGSEGLPASERELRQQRVISAAEKFVEDPRTLHPLNPIWDNQFMTLLEQGRVQELDAVVTKAFPPLPESRHMKSKPGSPLLPLFLHLATGVAKGVITARSRSGLPDLAG